ncbi:MAG: hypothetical protein ACOX2F_11415 [bacterium]
MVTAQNGWIVCLEPEKTGLLSGTKVHLTQCLACEVEECSVKGYLFSNYFPLWVDLESSPLNVKIMELNRTLAARKRRSYEFYCPKRKSAVSHCNAKSIFCRFNLICGKEEGKRTGANFIKSIRWRRVMVYVVIYLDGTSEVVKRSDFASIDIDKVARVYPGNYEIRIVSELVPLGEEKEKLANVVETFNEKYKGAVVTTEGLVNFEEWFTNGSNGDTAIIPDKILVPQKTYKVQRIRDVVSISDGKGAAKIEKIEPEQDESKVARKEKPTEKPAEKPADKNIKSEAKSKKKSETRKKVEREEQPSIFEVKEQAEKKPAKTIKAKKEKPVGKK